MSKLGDTIKKSFAAQIAICVSAMVIIITVYLFGAEWINQKRAINDKIVSDEKISFDIKVEDDKENLIFSGWLIREKSINLDVKVLLKAVDDSEVHLLDTHIKPQKDISLIFSDTWDYGDVAYVAEIENAKVKDNCYEVILIATYMDYIDELGEKQYRKNILTRRYLYNGELYMYNPNVYEEPSFEDERMKEVVDKGNLLLFLPDKDVWIYEYGNKLFWLMGEKFEFSTTSKTCVSYYVGTSRWDLLPEEFRSYRVQNLDFYFEDWEYEMSSEEKYRVAIRELPQGFPITNCYMGIYDVNTQRVLWGEFFYPAYDFE